MYDSKQYWLNRGKVYLQDFKPSRYIEQEQTLLKTIRELKPKKVLEVGCGFGRITKLLVENIPSIKEYHAMDISDDQLNNFTTYFKNANPFQVIYFQADILTPPPNLVLYDLIIAVEVLMHLPIGEVERAMQHMLQCSNKYVINLDVDYRFTKPLEEHGFIHDFPKLYQQCGYRVNRIVQIKKDTPQSIWVVTK